MAFNYKKTNYMFHPWRPLLRPPVITFAGFALAPLESFRYLGVIIDVKFSWIDHAKFLVSKIKPISHRLSMVVGSDWGICPAILRILVHRAILPMVTFASRVWGNRALDSRICRRLDSVLRPFLLKICRAFRTTSNQALFCLSGIPPVSIQVKQLYMHFQRISSEDYVTKIPVRRWIHPALRVCLPQLLFTDSSILTAYTDGSHLDNHSAAALVILRDNCIVYSTGIRLNDFNSVFQAEVYAICAACTALDDYDDAHVRIFSDSQSAITAISGRIQTDPIVHRARNLLDNLRLSRQVVFGWVKAHSGVFGNEEADRLAKESTSMDHFVTLPLPLSHSKTIMSSNIMGAWQHMWETSCKGRPLFRFWSQVSRTPPVYSRKLLQLLTGHGLLGCYFTRFNLRLSDLCECGVPETADHVLFSCGLAFRERARAILEKSLIPGGHDVSVSSLREALCEHGTGSEAWIAFADRVVRDPDV